MGLDSALVAPKLERPFDAPLRTDGKYGLDETEMGEETAEGVVLPFPLEYGRGIGMGREMGIRPGVPVRVVKRDGWDSRR